MERLVLTGEVHVKGPDFWGRSTSVLLKPVNRPGWFWLVNGEEVPIDQSVLSSRQNRLVLAYQGQELNVFEHLGALRFSGLDGVLIVPKTNWLPYDGSGMIFWNACKPYLKAVGTLGWCQTSEVTYRDDYVNNKWLQYSPYFMGDRGLLCVNVQIDYPTLGYQEVYCHIPEKSFEKIMSPKTQGWPRWRYPVAVLADRLGWPHKNNAVWPQEHSVEETLRWFAAHRRLDLLGALSTACLPGKILSGVVYSYRAGHKEDVEFIKQMKVVDLQPVLA